jgi:hypothetical protein
MEEAPMDSAKDGRLARARTSVEGLSVGDAFGEQFFSIHSDFVGEMHENRCRNGRSWKVT